MNRNKLLTFFVVAVMVAIVALCFLKLSALPVIVGPVCVIACAVVAVALSSSRKTHLGANVAEGVSGDGIKTFIADSTATLRFLVAKVGSVAGNADIAGAGDKPLGIFTDQPTAAQGTAVALLGAVKGTQRVQVNSAVANDDWLSTDATGYAKTLPTADGTYWVFGRALLLANAAAGDVVEFIPVAPFKVQMATGVATVRTS